MNMDIAKPYLHTFISNPLFLIASDSVFVAIEMQMRMEENEKMVVKKDQIMILNDLMDRI